VRRLRGFAGLGGWCLCCGLAIRRRFWRRSRRCCRRFRRRLWFAKARWIGQYRNSLRSERLRWYRIRV